MRVSKSHADSECGKTEQCFRVKCDLLRDHSADRENEKIDLRRYVLANANFSGVD